MNMSGESFLVILFVGLVAGWLAGQIVRGSGFRLVGDLVIGLLGAFLGSWLLPQLGVHLGTGVLSAIISASVGAVLLLLLVRLLRGSGGSASSWRGRWASLVTLKVPGGATMPVWHEKHLRAQPVPRG